jgi:hypothetical protein
MDEFTAGHKVNGSYFHNNWLTGWSQRSPHFLLHPRA